MNRPFDAKRYKRLLEGLEVVTLKFNEVIADNRVFRLDSQYFGKAALAAEAQIERGKWELLLQTADKVASFGAYALTNQFTYVEEGVPFLRCQNIRAGFVDFSDVLHIGSAANKLLSKSAVQPGMVLLTMSGSVGNAAVALPEWQYPINSNQDIAKIAPKESISPHYLSAFLGSRFGRVQTARLPVGSVQQHIFLWMIERLKVARLGRRSEHAIADAVARAYESERGARAQLATAETVLTEALGLADWRPPQRLSYTHSALQAFKARRLDAEYFTPRVGELLARLRASGRAVRDVAPVRREKFVPAGNGEFPYIEIGNIAGDGTANVDMVEMADAPSRATQFVRTGDVLTSSVRPIRRLSALVLPEQDGAVASSGFVVLQPQRVASEVLLTYLRLPLVCELMDLHTSASLYPAISEADLLRLPFPAVGESDSQRIVHDVRDAHAARRRARELLAAAQRAVEIAIEQNEAAALAYLDGFDVAP